jgi:hypothetical protein
MDAHIVQRDWTDSVGPLVHTAVVAQDWDCSELVVPKLSSAVTEAGAEGISRTARELSVASAAQVAAQPGDSQGPRSEDRESISTGPVSFGSALWRSTFGSPGFLIFGSTSTIAYRSGEYFAASVLVVVALFACVNRFRVYTQEKQPEVEQSTWIDKAVSFLRSPTVDFRGASAYLAVAAVEAGIHLNWMVLPYLLFSFGEAQAGKLQARKLARISSVQSEDSKVSERYVRPLENPPIYFALGNTGVGFLVAQENLLPLVPGMLASAVVVGAALVSKRSDSLPPSGAAFRALCLSQVLFGVGYFLSLDVPRAIAFLVVSPIGWMQARDMDRERRLAQQERNNPC